MFTADGSLLVALGSPGSNLIPSIIANVISNLVDRGMDFSRAVAAPRVLFGGSDALTPWIEVAQPITDADVDALETAGHATASTSGGVGAGRRWGSARGPRVDAEPPTAR